MVMNPASYEIKCCNATEFIDPIQFVHCQQDIGNSGIFLSYTYLIVVSYQ